MGWCCSSDGMIIPRSRKYTGLLRYHLSPCGYTVTCLSLDHVSTRDPGLATAPRLPITPFLDSVSTDKQLNAYNYFKYICYNKIVKSNKPLIIKSVKSAMHSLLTPLVLTIFKCIFHCFISSYFSCSLIYT